MISPKLIRKINASARKIQSDISSTLFGHDGSWKLNDCDDPMNGWNASHFQGGYGHATDDIYGALYFHIRRLVHSVCSKFTYPRKITISLNCQDALTLPDFYDFPTPVRFDRIDTSNLADDIHLGIHRTLELSTGLLKDAALNRHACVITSFLNMCPEVATIDDHFAARYEHQEAVQSFLEVECEYFSRHWIYGTYHVRAAHGYDMVRDYDDMWRRYEQVHGVNEAGTAAGLRRKKQNTVISEWPLRWTERQGASEDERQSEWWIKFADPHSGAVRYMEWKPRGFSVFKRDSGMPDLKQAAPRCKWKHRTRSTNK
jgi:hypothetical protein